MSATKDTFIPNTPPNGPLHAERRTFLYGALMVGGQLLLSSQSSSAFALGTKPLQQPVPAAPISDASLSITSAPEGAIGSAFAGFSLEKSVMYSRLLSASNHNAVGLYRRLGPSLLRLGGDTVDKTVWAPHGAGRTHGQIAAPDVDALAGFLKATGWQCLYGVNLGGAASGVTSPALAAAEVAYVAAKLGSALYGIEIGNEPDSFGVTNHAFAGKAWSLEIYTMLWKQYRQAIVDAVPGVLITGPAAAKNVGTWTVPFGIAVTKNNLQLLTQHYYRANRKSPDATIANLISPDKNLEAELAELKAGAQKIGIPFRMAECNSYAGGGAPGVSNAYASALWVIDYLFDCALADATGADFHGGGDGPRYQAIANNGDEITEVRPLYYGLLFFSLIGKGRVRRADLSTSAGNATGYAVNTASGTSLVVVNKEPRALSLTATLPSSIRSATLRELRQHAAQGQSDLSATDGVTVQGGQVRLNGDFTPQHAYELTYKRDQLTFYVPAMSAVLIQTR